MFNTQRPRDDSGRHDNRFPQEPPGTFHVFVATDGTTTVNGERLPPNGNRVETAVLDELHRHAENRDGAVEATVIDQRHRWILRVRVTPDGASELAAEPRELRPGAGDSGSQAMRETTDLRRTPAHPSAPEIRQPVSEQLPTSAIPVQAAPQSGGFVSPPRQVEGTVPARSNSPSAHVPPSSDDTIPGFGSEEAGILAAYPIEDPDAPQTGVEEPPTVAFPSLAHFRQHQGDLGAGGDDHRQPAHRARHAAPETPAGDSVR
jgi:hypothetical protein